MSLEVRNVEVPLGSELVPARFIIWPQALEPQIRYKRRIEDRFGAWGRIPETIRSQAFNQSRLSCLQHVL